MLICGFGAGLGWLAYLAAMELSANDILSAFLAAVVIGGYSEWMARLRRCPVTGYLQVALLPLVPGAGIYHAMQYCVSGYTQLFLTTLLHTFGMAAACRWGLCLHLLFYGRSCPDLPPWGDRLIFGGTICIEVVENTGPIGPYS